MEMQTMANRKFQENEVFRRDDQYYYIEAVREKQPHDILYCVPFDHENMQPLPNSIAERVNSNTLSALVYNGGAAFINTDPAFKETISPTPHQQTQIEMWLDYIDKLKQVTGGKLSRAVKDIEAAKLLVNWQSYKYFPPSNSTCQKRVKDYDDSQRDPRAICPKGYHAMQGATRIALKTEELIENYITDEYLVATSDENANILRIYRNFKREFEELHKESPEQYPTLPCKQTFYARLKRENRFVVATSRLNKNQRNKLRKLRSTNFIIDRILERVEIDAVHVGMGIIEEVGTAKRPKRRYRGRIVIMVAIDVFSRAIIGYSYHIAPKPGENIDLAVECFKSILLPKNHPNWPIYGKPQHLIADATTSSTSQTFNSIVTSVGTTFSTTPRGEPWKKPFIERFFRTFRQDFLTQFDTYLGSKQYRNHDHLNNNDTVDKKVMDPMSQHCFTEAEFVELFENYIVEHYNVNPHRGLLGKTPLQVWRESASQCALNFTTVPSNHPALNRLALFSSGKTIDQDGYIRFINETYSAPVLKQMYGDGIDKVDVYFSRINSKYVSFEYKGNWYTAKLNDHNYTPEDTDQRSALEEARKNHGVNVSTALERKDFNASPSKAANKQATTRRPTKSSKPKVSNAIDTDDANAAQQLAAAEAESMQYASDMLKNEEKHEVKHEVKNDAADKPEKTSAKNARHTIKIGGKL